MNKVMTPVTTNFISSISEKNNYLSKIMREIGCTYSHIIKIGHRLEELKIIIKHREGRKIKVKLTKKGEEIQSHLNAINSLI